ncbi:MAG: amidohydrolase family protein, partial [Vulcanimicrobiaceae bacterium]
MKLDLVIRSDCAFTPAGAGAFDIAIAGGKIVAVAAAGTFKNDTARRLIDARGKVVMPGGIDPHVHCSWTLAYPDGKPFLSDPP